MDEVKKADPSALGLFGLAVATLVASSQKHGITVGTAMIIPWGFFLGGLAQFTAGIIDFKRANVLGGTAFCCYGLFWFSASLMWLFTNHVLPVSGQMDLTQGGVGFIGYLIITLFFTVGALETNKVLFAIFFFIDLLFLGMSVDAFTGSVPFHKLAAYSETILSLLSFYGAGASVLKNHFGRDILPVGKPFGLIKK